MVAALVVGLLPEQARRVEAAVGHRYRLKFVGSNHAKAIRHFPEVTVMVTRYLTHGAIQRAQRHASGEIHYINGRDREVIACLEKRT